MRSNILRVATLLCLAATSGAQSLKSFPGGAVNTIALFTDGGAITLNVSDDGNVSVEASPAAAPGCVVAQSLKAGTLTLTVRSAGKPLQSAATPCPIGFAVSAPAAIGIKARSRSGDVEFGAFSGNADIRTSSGAIVLHGASGALILRTVSGNVTGGVGGQGKIDVETRSGDVSLRGLTSSIKARSGGGAIALAWAGAPQAGNIDVRTVSGDFAARLPEDAKMKISLKSGSGKVRSEFASDAASSLSLTFRSDSGYATLKKSHRVSDAQQDIGSTEIFDREDLLRW